MSSQAAPPAGRERSPLPVALAGLLILMAFLLTARCGAMSESWRRLVAWSGLAAPLVGLLVRLGRPLFGPVFFYEIVRGARSGRLHALRFCFTSLVFLFLWLAFCEYQTTLGWNPHLATNGVYQAELVSRFARSFFHAFLYVQFAAVVLLTPAYLGGVIAAEKDGRRLESLLVTDLSSRDIVLGKLFAGLYRLGLVLLAGLPILALMEFLGGVDPNLLLVGYAATAVTMLSLGSLSILCSVCCRKPRDAIVLTYLIAMAFLCITYLLHVLAPPPYWWSLSEALQTLRRSEFPAPVEALSRGNPAVTLLHLQRAWESGATLEKQLPGTLLPYLLVHGLAALLCTTWAVLRLKASVFASAPALPGKRLPFWQSWRRVPGRLPLLWKEIVVDQHRPFWQAGRALCLVLLLIGAIPVLRLGWRAARDPLATDFAWLFADIWCRLAVTALASLTLVGVAIHAAGTLSSEIEQRTLDSLLTTPLGLRSILFSKWLGSLLSARRSWSWLLALWALSMFCGGTHGRCLLMFLGAWIVYGGCFAMLGMWFSVRSANTQKALLWTLTSVALLSLSHWLLWLVVDRGQRSSWPAFPATVQVYGLTPPAALGWIALRSEALFDGEDYRGDISVARWGSILNLAGSDSLFRRSDRLPDSDHLASALAGLVTGAILWLGFGALLWFDTWRRLGLLAATRTRTVRSARSRLQVCAWDREPATVADQPA